METETILNKLRELMNTRNWGVSQLADNAELSRTTIYGWFDRGVHPTPESLDKICKVFGLTINEFYAVDYDELIKAKVDKLIEECKNLNEKQIDFFDFDGEDAEGTGLKKVLSFLFSVVKRC